MKQVQLITSQVLKCQGGCTSQGRKDHTTVNGEYKMQSVCITKSKNQNICICSQESALTPAQFVWQL
jgi:hypothetical protein